MKKAFTLIELLVVIAIIAILAAMLMPALSRAREEARKTQCRTNVHNVGIGFHLFLTDNDGVYPGWVDDDLKEEIQNDQGWQDGTTWSDHTDLLRYATPTDGDPYYQLVTRGYLDSVGLFDCPTPQNMSTRNWGGGPVVFTNTIETPNVVSEGGQEKVLQFAEYGYDLGRVSRNSVAGRVFYGDLWEHNHQWGPTQGHWDYNHRDGANVLHIDQAVEWAKLQDEYVRDSNGIVTSLWDADGWARQGWIPNPRMDEDIHRYQVYEDLGLVANKAELMYPMDHDDVFVIEGWSSGGTVDPFRWSYIGDPTMRDGYGGSGEWSSNCSRMPEPGASGSAIRRYRFWSGINSRRMYPEKGAFAEEPRWDTHDSRIIPFGSFYVPGW